MNINDEKDLRPSPKTHPINTNTRPRQLSLFNDQLADFREHFACVNRCTHVILLPAGPQGSLLMIIK